MRVISVLLITCTSLTIIQAGELLQGMLKDFELSPSELDNDNSKLTSGEIDKEDIQVERDQRFNLGSIGKLIDSVKNKTSDVYNTAKNKTSDVYNSAKNKTSDVYNTAKNKTSDVYNSAKNKTSDIYNSAKNKTSDVYNSAKNKTGKFIKDVRDKISSWTDEMMRRAANVGGKILLAEFKLILKLLGIGNELNLPDITTSTYGIKVNATGGQFRSLASLVKDGDVNVTREKINSILFDIPVKFNEMRIDFNHFEVKAFLLFDTSGNFTVKCNKSNIIIKLRLSLATCIIDVEKVIVNKFGEIDIKFNGLGKLANKITNTIVDYLNNQVKSQLESAINTNLKAAINNKPMICSSFIPS